MFRVMYWIIVGVLMGPILVSQRIFIDGWAWWAIMACVILIGMVCSMEGSQHD